ncbi:N-acetyl-alpha-D-glucosaminyl L-malate synthase BshA [Sporosarcina thermotolerans]|uniref:N-acetyl-alpha-D-glucosaminyl L-malate synthase BshA n=1 Tax=Sporosarcina thermotolerans TaxID=633404 RepID=A0AAW9A707_9BACL|nr:N-acetyl-alpha-D-glucosaminyl L-malate synthase BshA [Sporosarcina thermotolerans]MDW0115540.1 N-acetyl-alpha-D-glucosaminyl L-malate synthase BshA [Sporosarcina thermotolerans]WHT47146.1 N-acetyl-alpha-D-glucosaminyl L-malate synthase BshA [Sporosarcina thermotolerans]
MNKLKVGVICYPSLGGSGVVATELGMKMAEKGHEMHYISSEKPFRLIDVHPNIHFHEVKIDGYAVFKYPPYDIALANRIAHVIQKEKLDLLHVHYAVPHAISAALAKDMAKSSIGVITTLHGTDVTVLGHDPALKYTVRYGIEKSEITTAVSESLRQDTFSLIEPDKEILTIYNFIDEDKYKPVDPGSLKKDLGIREEEKVIIHVSNFRAVKRVDDIIDSFKIIRETINAKLVLVGTGPEKIEMREKVKQEGLENEIIFTGKRDDLPELLAISDLMFLLSEKEAFGLVLLEGFACGVPAIATNIGGIPEVIEDGENGYLVELGDVRAAAEKAIGLLQDPVKHKMFRENALRTVHEKFDSTSIVNEYEELYYKVAGLNS